MSSIGGYFELELRRGAELHGEAYRLNTGRNAFECILRARGYRLAYLPLYTCDAMLQVLGRLRIEHKFYEIDEEFKPLLDPGSLVADEVFVATNYFGLMDTSIHELAGMGANVVVDNSQAFFSPRFSEFDTFYSARKYFGVPDGAYLYTNAELGSALEHDFSSARLEHLLLRLERGAEAGYARFAENDEELATLPPRAMSNLTRRLLESIDYADVARIRRRNFQLLEAELGESNQLQIKLNDAAVPMVYPLLAKNNGLREFLIAKGIYAARYWPNVLQWANLGSIEHRYARDIVHLPVDQRYGEAAMKTIIGEVKDFIGSGR